MAENAADLQAQVQRLQQMSQQLQQASQQRMQMEAMLNEGTRAVTELEELAEDATVYRNVGSYLVQDAGRDAAVARIKDDAETMAIRIKRTKAQEEQLRESLDALQNQLQSAFAKQQ